MILGKVLSTLVYLEDLLSHPPQVGGLQLKDAKPLEGDLKKFMDSATEGAVLVSFGSSLKPDQMPQEKIQVFIDTFKQLGMKVKIHSFVSHFL